MEEKRITDEYIPLEVITRRKGYSYNLFLETIREFSKIPLINVGGRVYIPILYVDDAVTIYECVYLKDCG